ncbi:alpha-hydroxy acid oxidase [Streptomyces sp. NPDC002120]|uniref:alpha-hydroxy acid oxidase n=1 Tax=Streptomyces sp. NPDC002120 TaxID=3364631 RepID=UPI00368DAD81
MALSGSALEESARAMLAPGAYDFYAAGSGEELSRDEAADAWRSYRFLPRVLRDVSRVDTGIELLGERLSSPVLAAPTAFHAMAHPEGEVATAEGIRDAGQLMVLSSRATSPVEGVAAAAGPWWFQVYVLRDREITARQVRRAVAAGARALVLTVDAPYVATKPRVTRPLPLPRDAHVLDVGVDTRTADWEQDPSIGPGTIDWLRAESGLPVLVKGVLRADDALACRDAGAAGVIVSNHGGRQLDRALPTAHALRPVVEALAGELPVLVDGGIRTGTDVLTALALGADAVLIGRPVLWALAVEGRAGVRSLLDSYRTELAEAMALVGARSPGEIGFDLLAPGYRHPAHW